MESNLTEVVFILDKSGSMSGMEKDVVGGFNSVIKDQKKKEHKCIVSTVLFDNRNEVVHDRLPLNEIKDMEEDDYRPSGGTALIDALGDSIKYIKKVHKVIRKEDVPDHTLFVITTDGQENSSHKYSSEQVKKLIEQQQEKGWEFIYLAANIDAIETGKQFGFKESRSHNYVNDEKGTGKVYNATSKMLDVLSCVKCDDDIEMCVKEKGVFKDLDADYKSRKKKK